MPDDAVRLHARALADAVEGALGPWVERSVARISNAAGDPGGDLSGAAADAGRRATAEVVPQVRELLGTDVDEQRTTPLALLRGAAEYPTAVLEAAGVPAPRRDRMQAELLPDDVYDLAPASFADLGPEVAEAGLVWGAAKAHEHLRRRAARSDAGREVG